MADNVSITPGAGANILADEVTDGTLGTGLAQVVKIIDGTINGTNKWIISASGAGAVYFPSTPSFTLSGTGSVSLDAATITLNVAPVLATTGTQTSVAASASSVTLIASNAARKSVVIYNDSTADLYVRTQAAAASTSNFTFKLAGGGVYEEYGYSGEIRGIWSSATGNARVTERT